MIVDCFPFFNELDLLEIRLNYLAPYVDHFVIMECPLTWSGKPKPMYFYENRNRFKKFNIRYYEGKNLFSDWFNKRNTHHVQMIQREFLFDFALKDMDDEDILFYSDLDEIPDIETYNYQRGMFMEKVYYFYVNLYTGKKHQAGTMAAKKKELNNITQLYYSRKRLPVVGRGWHFSFVGTPETLMQKADANGFTVLWPENAKRQLLINRHNLQHPYHKIWIGNKKRDAILNIEDPSGPKYLLENRDKYKHLFYEEK